MDRIAGLRWSVMLVGVLRARAQAQATVGRRRGGERDATGAARYAIPLTLPPGTNGLAPALAIVYDSRSGNGLLGVGFRLAGLSAIQRCGSTLAQDGRLAGRTRRPDRLLSRRPAAAPDLPAPTVSRAPSTRPRARRLRASPRSARPARGPASFRVERRDGLIYEYGTTSMRASSPRQHDAARMGAEPDSRSRRQLRRLRLRGRHCDRQLPAVAHRLRRQPADRRDALLLGAVRLRGAARGRAAGRLRRGRIRCSESPPRPHRRRAHRHGARCAASTSTTTRPPVTAAAVSRACRNARAAACPRRSSAGRSHRRVGRHFHPRCRDRFRTRSPATWTATASTTSPTTTRLRAMDGAARQRGGFAPDGDTGSARTATPAQALRRRPRRRRHAATCSCRAAATTGIGCAGPSTEPSRTTHWASPIPRRPAA